MSDNSPPVSYNSAPIWKLGFTCEYVNQIENQLRPRGQKRCFTLWIKLCWIVRLKLGFTCEIYKQIQNQSSSCSKALLDFVNENYIGLRFWSLATHVINVNKSRLRVQKRWFTLWIKLMSDCVFEGWFRTWIRNATSMSSLCYSFHKCISLVFVF